MHQEWKWEWKHIKRTGSSSSSNSKRFISHQKIALIHFYNASYRSTKRRRATTTTFTESSDCLQLDTALSQESGSTWRLLQPVLGQPVKVEMQNFTSLPTLACCSVQTHWCWPQTDRCLIQTLLSSTYLVLLDSSSTPANLCSGNSYEVRSLLMQDRSYLWKTSRPNFFVIFPSYPTPTFCIIFT